MKFTLPIIALTSAVSVFGFSFPNLDKRQLSGNISDVCSKAADQYSQCIIDNSINDINKFDDYCNKFNSDKCQELFKIRVSGIKECQNEDKSLLTSMDGIIDAQYISVAYYCAMDENGKRCPLSELELNSQTKNKQDYKSLFETAKKETCKSKKCIDAFTQFNKKLETLIPNGYNKVEEIELLKTTGEYLNSKECTAQASSASAVKYSSALLLSIGLFFFSLF